jgi:hypothetical protein
VANGMMEEPADQRIFDSGDVVGHVGNEKGTVNEV